MSEETLIARLEHFGVVPASRAPTARAHLPSGHPDLDDFLNGGLPVGAITECGLPLGLGGRRIVLRFLSAIPGQPILWINPETSLSPFPPTWAAHGVDLADIGFVRTDHPMRDLKPALLDPLYRVVVFDFPSHLSKDDLAFLARQARAHRNVVLVLRSELLKEEKGNVWARLRLNCRRHPSIPGAYDVEVVRGLSPRRRTIAIDGEVRP